VVCVVVGVARVLVDVPRWGKRLAIAVVLLSSLFAMLCWAAAGSTSSMNLVDLTSGTVVAAIPIVLGALSGIMCERSGVINIAIEGQLLTGAFAAAMVSSAVGATTGLWFGTLAGALTGGLVGLLLAIMASGTSPTDHHRRRDQRARARLHQLLVDQVMVACRQPNWELLHVQSAARRHPDHPGHVSTRGLLASRTSPLIVIGWRSYTRYGLRVRAVGEHPTAADTVGIKVLWTRYRNVILGGMVAGIGGAWLTVGSTGQFNAGMSNGIGYIGLAAMIFGRWRPSGAVAAALLFGFCGQLAVELEVLAVPIPPQILSMAPYAATIVAVAGLIGKVRAPAADGKPYVKA
jgi:simple sugar transport system permease protein